MKFFWPHRSNAKGFVIQNLERKYSEKIRSVSSNEKNTNQLLEDRILILENKDSKNIDLSHPSTKKVHWANRDFSEYRETA